MGMKFRNRMKKILTEALVAGLLLVPAALPYTGAAEGSPEMAMRARMKGLCPVGI